MGYAVSFALLLAGYALIDWGHYAIQGKSISLWYLLSGHSGPYVPPGDSQATAGTARPGEPS
jgi:hypothetical protein